jgi:hypothetical protein
MPSLVIHAPEYQTPRPDMQSFQDTFDKGVGKAYALDRTISRQLPPEGAIRPPGWRVVLLCKDRRRRAEGDYIRIEPAAREDGAWFARNHTCKYNVYVENFVMVPYRPEALNRHGVAVI